MLDQPLAPLDSTITIAQLTEDPYPIYKRLRAEAPVMRVQSVGRTLLTKAEDTKYVKDTPEIFSSDDPDTPMKRAFHAHTLMRKDGPEHRAERMAMAPAFSPRALKERWIPQYEQLAGAYLDRLPKGEAIDLFPALAGPIAARILAISLGIGQCSDAEMQHWSQALIDGAGNFGWDDAVFKVVDDAHDAMNAAIESQIDRVKADPDGSALDVMVNTDKPIPWSQVLANIKIAIGGGINEPRDALLTAVVGLLTNPDQLAEVKRQDAFNAAFEEAVRWCAPIQASSRRALEDTVIRGCLIPKGDVVMTIQASANHDEDLFEDGHLFNAFRDKNPHQSFGSGPHHCLGAQMARATVGKILLPMMFKRFPNMRLVDPDKVVWRGFGFRGPITVPVLLD